METNVTALGIAEAMEAKSILLAKMTFAQMCADYDAGALSHANENTYRRILRNVFGCDVQTISEFSWEDRDEDVFYFHLISRVTGKSIASHKVVR